MALARAGVADMNTGDPKGIRSGLYGPGRFASRLWSLRELSFFGVC